jgi:nucleotide-binding universal stress UspA family protein
MGWWPDGDRSRARRAWEEAIKEGLMAGSIICGVDDSESAKGAARVARELSEQLGLRLVFVRVVEDGPSDAKIAAVTARLQHFADSAAEVDRGSHWLVDVGHPADRLVAAAEDESATLIVVGSTGPRSSLLGSISADVSRRAPCPVVVVAPGADGALVDGRAAEHEPEPGEHGAPSFAGGIVRFSLGGGGKR